MEYAKAIVAAETSGRAERRAGYGAGVALFVVVWLVTYAKALVMGDDVNHLQGVYGKAIFWPDFSRGWIPNRVVDLYGRHLLGEVFDAVYFPAHQLFGVDFFHFFKVFNATLFAALLCVVHRYLMMRLAAWGARPGMLVGLVVAAAVFFVLPWTNEVRAVCYQLPGFLCFVVLTEIFALMQGALGDEPARAGMAAPWVVTVGFVAAFSLESDAAIMLLALAVAWGLAWPWWRRGWWRGDAAVVSAVVAGFCVVAVVLAFTLSDRAAVGEDFQPVRAFAAYFLHHAFLQREPRLYARMLAYGVAGLAVMFAWRRRFAALCGWGGALPARWRFLRGVGPAGVVGCATLVVVALLCFETNQDFFSMARYPWGGALLIAEFFGVLAVAPAAFWLEGVLWADAARVLVMMVVLSRLLAAAVGQAQGGEAESEKVLAVYQAAFSGKGTVIDTGLGLAGMEKESRPLPGGDSAAWAVAGYRALFEKYYGVETEAVFK